MDKIILQSSSIFVLVNDNLTAEFVAYKGLRKRDHLATIFFYGGRKRLTVLMRQSISGNKLPGLRWVRIM